MYCSSFIFSYLSCWGVFDLLVPAIYVRTWDVDRFSKSRSSRLQTFFKTGVFKNFVIFTGKHLCWSFFLTPTQMFSCEYCEILKNNFFQRTPASEKSIILINLRVYYFDDFIYSTHLVSVTLRNLYHIKRLWLVANQLS